MISLRVIVAASRLQGKPGKPHWQGSKSQDNITTGPRARFQLVHVNKNVFACSRSFLLVTEIRFTTCGVNFNSQMTSWVARCKRDNDTRRQTTSLVQPVMRWIYTVVRYHSSYNRRDAPHRTVQVPHLVGALEAATESATRDGCQNVMRS